MELAKFSSIFAESLEPLDNCAPPLSPGLGLDWLSFSKKKSWLLLREQKYQKYLNFLHIKTFLDVHINPLRHVF